MGNYSFYLLEQYLKKGNTVFVEGQLQSRKWQDQNGQDKYTTEVVLQGYNSNLTLLDSRNSSSPNEISNQEAESSSNSSERTIPSSSESDDDIPF